MNDASAIFRAAIIGILANTAYASTPVFCAPYEANESVPCIAYWVESGDTDQDMQSRDFAVRVWGDSPKSCYNIYDAIRTYLETVSVFSVTVDLEIKKTAIEITGTESYGIDEDTRYAFLDFTLTATLPA